jgi:hypothetical protein
MGKAVDMESMSRPRPDTLNNREPTPPKAETEGPQHETLVEEDDRIVFGSWDCALVPPLTRRD